MGFPKDDDAAQTSFDFPKGDDSAPTIHSTPPSAPQPETRFAAPDEIPIAPEAPTQIPRPPRDQEETSYEAFTEPPRPVSGVGRPGTGSGVRRPVTGGRRPASGTTGPLDIGQAFGERYHIIKVLGVGGMGAVYQAWDAELGVSVALKVIRPEIAADPFAALDIERRFKRELLLARQVTHKNVVRIHDLGEIDGIKYITMSFIDGSDLASIVKKETKLPVERAMKIARGIVSGLVTAHDAGVVHRDLKPANIMIGADGEPTIMDFGIARSSSRGAQEAAPAGNVGTGVLSSQSALLAGGTMAGAIIGTVEYMAPEQAKGEQVDQRADIYAFGLILYDILIGRRRSEHAQSAIAELQGRMEHAPPAPRTVNTEIPPAVDAIITRCLEPDAAKRFQTTEELQAAFARLDDNGKPLPIIRRLTKKGMAAAAVLVVLLLGGTFYLTQWLFAPPVEHEPISVVIADFQNTTGDSQFDLALGQTLRRALESATFITAYDRSRIRAGLGVTPPDKLDEAAARQLAIKQGVRVVLAGVIEPRGTGYEISVKALQGLTGNEITTASARAASKDQVLDTAARLMTRIRQALGDETSEADQIFATRTLSTSSLEVVSHYAAAVEAQSRGDYESARQSYQKAVDLDPKFGLGYLGMAVMSLNLQRREDAEKNVKEALRYLDGMTERERFSTRGLYYRIVGDIQQCAKEYGELIAKFPADAAGHNQLAQCLIRLRKMREALAEVRKAVEIVPNHATFRINEALMAIFAGEFAAVEELVAKMERPDFRAVMALAYSQMGRGMVNEASESYKKIATMGPLGAGVTSSGLGDVAVYQGRFADAVRILEEGAATHLAAKDSDGAADKYVSIGYAHVMAGQRAQAIAAAEKALANSKLITIRFMAARILVEAGAIEKAKPLAAALSSELPAEPQTYGRIVEGQMALKQGNARDAIRILTEANGVIDTWLGRFDLGRAYLAAGAFPQADSEFDRCLTRRGEVLALFDEGPTFGHFPYVHYYRGRVREEMKTAGYADEYREYLKIRGQSKEDPLVPEVRKRIQ